MSCLYRLFIIVIAFCACASALDRNAFTFTNYDMELRADPEGQAIAVRGNITLRNDSSQPQQEVALQISSTLEWRMIESNGKALPYLEEPLTSDLDHTGKLTEAVITLPAPVPPKGTILLDVGYSGTVGKDATRLTRIGVPQDRALASDWDRVSATFTGVRGIGHVAWYPIAAEAANLSQGSLFSTIAQWQQREARAQMKMRICWITEQDHSFTVVANGDFAGIGGGTAGGEGNRTGCSSYTFTNLSTTVPTFAIAPFEMLTRPLVSFYYLQGHDGLASDYAAAAEKVEPWLEDWFGKPKAKVEVVELPELNDAPFHSGAMLFTPLNTNDKRGVEAAMAHQLVHTMVRSPRPWISEGLAQFAQVLIRERQDGRQAALDFMTSQLPPLVAAEKQNTDAAKPSGDAAQSLISTHDEIYYGIKAMYVWYMLRDMVGDVPLKAALRKYQADLDKDPTYLQRLIAVQSKRDLEWFFDDWVYRDRGLPDFQLLSAPSRVTLQNTNVVAVTVENTGGAAAQVPISVTAESGENSDRLLVPAHRKETTRIVVAGKPTQVIVNDGSVPVMDSSKSRLDMN